MLNVLCTLYYTNFSSFGNSHNAVFSDAKPYTLYYAFNVETLSKNVLFQASAKK
jgi:hypothetical protein